MLTLWQRLREEPAMIGALLMAVVAIAAPRFGLSAEEIGLLMAAVAGATGVGIRQQVMPMAKIERHQQDQIRR